MTTVTSSRVRTRTHAPAPSGVRTATRRQSVALLGQLAAGAGNLVVSVLLARVLLPGEYAELTAFLAGYVLLHTVASSVTAATALDPDLHGRLRDRAAMAGMAVTVAGVLATPLLSDALGLSPVLVLLLAWSAPSATLLALARGRLYGLGRAGGTAAALVTEPLVRGAVGLALAPVIGPAGAAAGVVAAGYLSLLVALLAGRGGDAATVRRVHGRTSVAVTIAFLLVAVMAAQDVVVANRLLAGDEAGFVAAVATIGGAAYFATATIPMVLMPSGGDESSRGSLAVALGAATAVSLALVAAVALVPASLFAQVLGERYAEVGPYATGYVGAMAALGVAKVLAARLCMTGRSPVAAVLAGVAVVVQLALLLRVDDVADVVRATAAASALFLLSCAAATLLVPARTPVVSRTVPAAVTPRAPVTDAPAEPRTGGDAPAAHRHPRLSWGSLLRDGWPLLVALVVGTALRLMVTRSIWLDEAISIRQVQQPLGTMLVDLRENDVHPPGFNLLLWAVVQATGSTSELVVRLPSLTAGIALIAVFWAMGRDLWDRRTGIVAALVVAVAPVAVWYAQEARMYSLWMLATTVALWMQVRILRDARDGGRGRGRDWTVFVLSSTALVYLQWFAVLPVLVQHVLFLGCLFRADLRRIAPRWIVSVLASLALFAPLVPFLLAQARSVMSASSTTPGQTGVGASEVVGDSPDVYAVLANTIWSLWGYHADELMVQASALWPVLLLLCLAALGRGRSIPVGVLVAAAVVPVVVLFGIGFERRQLFELRYFTSTVPVLLLLVSRLVATWARGPVSRLVLPGVVVVSLLAGLADQQVNQSNPRTYDFRGAVSWVERTAEPGDLMLYAPAFLEDELAYYSAGIRAESTASLQPGTPGLGLPRTLGPDDSIFVFASFLDEQGTSGQVGQTLAQLEQQGWSRADTHKVANVTVWQLTHDKEVAQ